MSEPQNLTNPTDPPRTGLSIVLAYLRAPLIAYGPFVVGAPVAASVISLSASTTALLFAGGFCSWSFFEYAVHRFIQHSPRIRRYIRRWDDHAEHHAEADDPEGFVNSLSESVPIAVIMQGLFLAVLPSWAAGISFGAGFLFAYLVYEWIHCASHLQELHRDRPWLAAWSLNHRRHHWERANAYYGFTTSLWDRLLGTHPAPRSPSSRRVDVRARGEDTRREGPNDELV
jgi:sterol desaturase/sphingolipid hydroxylase (fatty acid hydroxylase superfamily)